MPIYLFIIILVVMFALMVSAWIPWRSIFEKRLQNNPTIGLIYIEFGEDVDCCECSQKYSNKTAIIYSYKWRGQHLVVFVKDDYGFKFLHGRRMIRLAHPGDLWATPWDTGSLPKHIQKSAYDANAVIEGHIGVELVRSIFKSAAFSLMNIVMIVGVIAIAWFVVKPMMEAESSPPPPPPPPPQERPIDVPEVIPHAGWRIIDYVG